MAFILFHFARSFFFNQCNWLFSHGRKIKESNLTQQRNFSSLSGSLFTITHFLQDGRKQTLIFMNFEDHHHFQNGCHEATSCVGIRAQLLLVDCVSIRIMIANTHSELILQSLHSDRYTSVLV